MSDIIFCSGQPLHVGEEGLQLVHRKQVNALHQLGGEYIRLECDNFIRHGGYISGWYFQDHWNPGKLYNL